MLSVTFRVYWHIQSDDNKSLIFLFIIVGWINWNIYKAVSPQSVDGTVWAQCGLIGVQM